MRHFSIILITIICLCLALTGCDTPVFDNSSTKQETDKYVYVADKELKAIDLVTVKEWQDTKSRKITFNAQKAPWIFNVNFKRISSISTDYEVQIYKKTDSNLSLLEHVHKQPIDAFALIKDTGEYIIDIRVSGMEWEARVGVEP
jgi:hypothetical protein